MTASQLRRISAVWTWTSPGLVSASPQLTQQERAKAEALADRALHLGLEALKTFEAEVPNARTYLIEVFGNLARDTRRQIIESYLSPEDAVRKRGINLAVDELRSTLGNDTGDPLERLLIERIVRGPRKLDHFGCEICRVAGNCTIRQPSATAANTDS
ncbi:hypothetical protein OAF45_00060 [Candidatus Latescibacteria bacterium]|nr:hypothetical protein [Candidatus Latescibacterota bacterium]